MAKTEVNERMTYYKLSDSASVFYDPQSNLKVLSKVPGKLSHKKKTKKVIEATRAGHIIEIDENTYNSMMEALPEETRKHLQGGDDNKGFKTEKKVVKEKPSKEKLKEEEEEDEEEDGDDNPEDNEEEKAKVIEKINEYELTKADKKKIKNMSLEELNEYLKDLES